MDLRKALTRAAYAAFGLGTAGGVWLFLHEVNYAMTHTGRRLIFSAEATPAPLSAVLQVAGLVLAVLGVGGLIVVALASRPVPEPRGAA